MEFLSAFSVMALVVVLDQPSRAFTDRPSGAARRPGGPHAASTAM
jgi:hypothetical protein